LRDKKFYIWNRLERIADKEFNAYDIIIRAHAGGSKANKIYNYVEACVVFEFPSKLPVCVLSIGKHSYHTFKVFVKELDENYLPSNKPPCQVNIAELKNDMSCFFKIQQPELLKEDFNYIEKLCKERQKSDEKPAPKAKKEEKERKEERMNSQPIRKQPSRSPNRSTTPARPNPPQPKKVDKAKVIFFALKNFI